ncbi:MAG TPA: hypothetical protein VLB09_04935 [Nitrospiria bacterium]|nr:hypothetical protein [Nitrospiria bacterium]
MDQLAKPGEDLHLQVRLVTGGLAFFQRPISGERIDFLVGDEVMGQSLSGGNGLAVRRYKPETNGLQIVTVRLAGGGAYQAEPADIMVSVIPPETPILLVHLSSTKVPEEPPAVPFSPSPTSDAMVGSIETLEILSENHQLVYLETGTERRLPGSRGWLVDQGFPDAPLFTWSLSGPPENRKEAFLEKIEELKAEGWRNIRGLVTRFPGEADAVSGAGMKGVLMLDEDDDVEVGAAVVRVTSWDDVPVALKKH